LPIKEIASPLYRTPAEVRDKSPIRAEHAKMTDRDIIIVNEGLHWWSADRNEPS
jgi:hypothetical protein